MNKIRIALLVAVAMCHYPLSAHAQAKKAGKKGAAKAAAAAPAEAQPAAEPAAAAPADQAAAPAEGAAPAADANAPAEGAAQGEGEEGEGEEEGAPPQGSALDEICKVDPDACPKVDFEKEAARDLKEQVYAVQQVFALRVRRFELQPYWAFTLNDQFVAHPGPGLGVNYWITQVLAIGVNGNYYQPFTSDSVFNFQTRRAARIAVPLTEYQWGAAVNFTYVPVAGKFAGFGDFIFQYDAYVVGGVGALSTRPIPTVDPDNRSFSFEPKLAFNAGIGLRIFFNRWFAADLEVRDYIYPEKLENTQVDRANPTNKATWYEDSARLTNAVQAQLGISVFIPFSFDYRLPK